MQRDRRLQELTKGEEEVMQILWEIGSGTINDIIARMDEPKPKYTTVATFVKLLENKEFVGHTAHGKSFIYSPRVERESYAGRRLDSMLSTYFGGSLSQLVNFFAEREDVSVEEMDSILQIIERAKQQE